MEDKSALLNQLRIDRESEPPRSAKWPLWLAGAAGVLIIAGLAWFWSRPKGIPVHVAVAQPISADNAAAPASILDASGYVVRAPPGHGGIRRSPAKMVELDIEEGDHVKPDR